MSVAPEVKPIVDNGIERWPEAIHEDCFGWAMVCCRWNRAEAMETLQTSYVRALEAQARLNGCLDRRAWLLGVIRRVSLERRRSRAMSFMGLLRWQRMRPAAAGPTGPDS